MLDKQHEIELNKYQAIVNRIFNIYNLLENLYLHLLK